MNNDKEKIDNLKKVTLLIEAGRTGELMDLTSEPFKSEFIFGLAPDGLTLFEYELSGKIEGDECLISLKREEFHKTFQHLCMDFIRFSQEEDLHLKIQVKKVLPADNGEIIKALAKISSCDHKHCSCGCH